MAEVLRLGRVVDVLALLAGAFGTHAGDLLQPAFHLADALVVVPREFDALLEVRMGMLGSIRDVGEVLAQLAVLAEDTRSLPGERSGLFQPSLDVLGVADALREGPVDLAQPVVDALRHLEALPLQLLAARERLLERALRLAVARLAAVLLDRKRPVRADRLVQLRMAQPVARELVLGDRLDPLALAFASRLPRRHPAVRLLGILHARIPEPLVEVSAVLLQ